MEEEIREQPAVLQADVPQETTDICAESNAGSQTDTLARQASAPEQEEFGKFKSAKALLDAYNNLEAEFTKKCQMLSQLEKDKAEEGQNLDLDDALSKFLSKNGEAVQFSQEIKELVTADKSLQNVADPIEAAWAKVVLSHVASKKASDPIINRYILSSNEIKEKIVENYLDALKNQNSPIIISSNQGQRVSSTRPDTPSSLKEAKSLVEKMFS